MAQLLVRDLDDDVVAWLKRRAERHGRSAEAEHRAVLESARRSDREAFIDLAQRLRGELAGRKPSDSTEIIRAFRDRDGSID